MTDAVSSTSHASSTTQETRSVSSTGAEKGVKPIDYALLPSASLTALTLPYTLGIECDTVVHPTSLLRPDKLGPLSLPDILLGRARLYYNMFADNPEDFERASSMRSNQEVGDVEGLYAIALAMNAIRGLWAYDTNVTHNDPFGGEPFDVVVLTQAPATKYINVLADNEHGIIPVYSAISGRVLHVIPDYLAVAASHASEHVMAALSEHYHKGAQKYAAHNWRKGYEWGKSYAASRRHFGQWVRGERYDEEMGTHHLIAAIWHLVTLTHYITNPRTYGDMDDRAHVSLHRTKDSAISPN